MIKQILIAIPIGIIGGYLGAWFYYTFFERTAVKTKEMLEHLQKMEELHNHQWQVTLSPELLNETKTKEQRS